MIKIYGIKNCNTMKKAFDELAKLNLPYDFHDYKKLGIDEASVRGWIDQVGLDIVLNKKGTTWRKLSEEEQAHVLSSEQNTIAAMVAQPSMIKRPVLIDGDKILVGFDETAYQGLAG